MMKKLLAVAAAATLILSCSFAMADMGSSTSKMAVKCAVTGQPIGSPSKAGGYTVYKGHTYYFCCTHCLAKFKASPAKYAKKAYAYPADAPHPKPAAAMNMAPGSKM